MEIDVIVPIYKVEKYLRKCIDSLIGQTYKDINIILVDDGSPDNCGVICDEYARKYDNIIVLHKENGGLSDARNYGMLHSSAELIMFLDSDDWIELDMIELMVKHMQDDVDIVACHSILEFPAKISSKRKITNKVDIVSNESAIKMVLDKKLNVSAWGKLYRRILFEKVQYPINCLHEDVPVIFQLLDKVKKVAIINSHLHHYRQQESSISHGNYTKRNFKFYEFVKETKWIVDKYPSMKDDYYGFYYRVVKSLMAMFKDDNTIDTYYDDYCFFQNILQKNIFNILVNRSITIKDKITICLVLTPLYDKLKQFYNIYIR